MSSSDDGFKPTPFMESLANLIKYINSLEKSLEEINVDIDKFDIQNIDNKKLLNYYNLQTTKMLIISQIYKSKIELNDISWFLVNELNEYVKNRQIEKLKNKELYNNAIKSISN